jgi:hypothetical protein
MLSLVSPSHPIVITEHLANELHERIALKKLGGTGKWI